MSIRIDLIKKLHDDPLFQHALTLLSGSQVVEARRYVENHLLEVQNVLSELGLVDPATLVTVEPTLTGSIG